MYIVRVRGAIYNFTYNDYERGKRVYENQVKYIDKELSRLFTILSEEYAKNSIVVFYSNHGEGLMDNGVFGHLVTYQSNIHVPLLIKHPKIDKAIVIDTPTALIDLAPTLYEMLGVEIKHNISGQSLIPLITKGEYSREFIYGDNKHNKYVRKGDWKLVVTGSTVNELYNITADPHETNNLYENQSDIAWELEAQLTKKELEVLEFETQFKKIHNMTD
jgi:arylsulfatase A-like enzyme